MADKKYWLGTETLPQVWIWICVFFNLFGILALIQLTIAEILILTNNFNTYVDQYGHKYPSRGYVGEAGCGFVEYSNAPKHLGSAIWMLFYQLSIVILATLTIASDLAWRSSGYNAWGQHYVAAFFAVGIMPGTFNPGFFYYVIANAFLKLFIVVLYMSQSFWGLAHGSHEYKSTHTVYNAHSSAACSASWGATTGSGCTSSAGCTNHSTWKRANPDKSYGTELWAFWCGWLVFGSIVPSIIAFMFLVPWAASKNGGGAGAKDTEKASEVTVTAAKSSTRSKKPSS